MDYREGGDKPWTTEKGGDKPWTTEKGGDKPWTTEKGVISHGPQRRG